MENQEPTTFDHPVWRCEACHMIFHSEPERTDGYKFKLNGYWQFKGVSKCFCPHCSGDVSRFRDAVPLATSVRPVAPIKGDRRSQMWRWRCYSCGRVSEVAHGSRLGWRWSSRLGFLTSTPPQKYTMLEKCIPCGRENRIVFHE